MVDKLAERPDCPQAFSFDIYSCNDPLCGPHIIPVDADGEPICEMVIPLDSIPSLVKELMEFWHKKKAQIN